MILVGGIGALQFNLSALGEPNCTETYLATLAKYFLVRRASRAAIPLSDLRASIAEADKLYGTECAGMSRVECAQGDGFRRVDVP
jgi:hypothetical protein